MSKLKKFQLEILRGALFGRQAEAVTTPKLASTDPTGELNDLLELAIAEGRLVYVDWREETASIVTGVNRLLMQLNIDGFDWSFHDHLIDIGVGEAVRNNNFLCHVRDQLREIGLHLIHINIFDDGYRFFATSSDQFSLIDRMQKKNVVEISDDFGGDEYYSIGRVHLGAVGFSQPVNKADRSEVQSKQQVRRITSLYRLLDDESVLHEGEDADSLVPPYARFEVPTHLDDGKGAWSVYLNASLHASWAARRASKRMLAGEQAAGSVLADCWNLTLLSRKFLEQAYLDSILEYPKLGDLLEHVSFYDAGKYWDFTIAATAFYFFGFNSEWRECSVFYPMFERRFEISGAYQPEMERMQWALIKFLSDDSNGEERLNQLARTVPFGPLFGTWNKDGYFAQAIDALCEWHLQQCHAAIRGDSEVHSPGYDFLPTWILAIDRNRERTLGRSCLPNNQLLGIASKYIGASFRDKGSEIAEKVGRLYDNTYGYKSVDLLQVWDSYLSQR